MDHAANPWISESNSLTNRCACPGFAQRRRDAADIHRPLACTSPSRRRREEVRRGPSMSELV
eukprot:9903422-Alexandrium_andersonii.AAC.1